MARKKLEKLGRVEVSVDNLKLGDEIYISPFDNDKYEVLDIGTPFILILNKTTNFANLYKCYSVFIEE